MGRSSGTGRLKSTERRAVRPQLSASTSDQAMTSSRIVETMPPWAISSQPWNRDGIARSVQQRSPSTWSSRWRPPAFRVPQAKQLWGSNAKRSSIRCATLASDVKVPGLPGLGLDEVLARRDLLTHQHREDRVGLRRILDLGPQERPCLRVHRRLPELIGVHLAEALEALNRDVLLVDLLDDLVPFLLGLGVAGDLAGADPVERRLGDVELAVLDDLRQVPVEERQQQRSVVAAVE